jgi:hypothetical protein
VHGSVPWNNEFQGQQPGANESRRNEANVLGATNARKVSENRGTRYAVASVAAAALRQEGFCEPIAGQRSGKDDSRKRKAQAARFAPKTLI